jgi:biotin carboxyl carrier protein
VKLKVTVDQKVYEVEVEASEPEHAPLPISALLQPGVARVPAAPSAAAPAPKADEGPVDEDKVCRSPINGIVVRVAAQPGQQIQPGDTLVVLEAMKMETAITAPVAGKVAEVKISQGDGVQAGQILVSFE